MNNDIDSAAESDDMPGDLYPETAIHNLEQTSDKVESDMLYRKSEIPTREDDSTRVEDARDTHVGDKAVYNIGQDVSLEIPLTTQIQQPRVEELTKRDVIPQKRESDEGKGGSKLNNKVEVRKNQEGSNLINNDQRGSKVVGTSSTSKSKSTRRNEVPLSGASIFPNALDDPLDDDFQVRDKSADLEIHADSSGVRVKAKPASLQVVSNPHGDVKTLPGETHSSGVVAERRTFTPLLPADKLPHHHHLHGLAPRHLPFLRHHHHFHHLHHRLPWLRHRQHINYPDVFERMRSNPMPMPMAGPSPFAGMESPFTFTPPMAPMMSSPSPMTSMMNSPPSMLSDGEPGMSMMGGGGMGGPGGGGMGGPLIPQLLQRSPTMETNPANRFGVPDSPMDEMSSGGMPSMDRMSPMGDMSPMGRMSSMGDMPSMGRMSFMGDMSPMGRVGPMGDMSLMSRMNAMGDMPLMGRMNPMGGMPSMGRMGQMESMMGPMSPSAPFGENVMRRKSALEFWGMPNQDQLRALARGENVQKVLGSNKYGETLGGITPGGTNPLEGMSPGMGGASFNANGMGNMMGSFGGRRSAMFRGISRGMPNAMRMRPRNMLFKKDKINRSNEKKSKNVKKPRDNEVASGSTKYGHEKFEDGILKKAKSLVAGKKHRAKNAEAELYREHRIRKSSKLPHEEERR